jgi:hypothetical protein
MNFFEILLSVSKSRWSHFEVLDVKLRWEKNMIKNEKNKETSSFINILKQFYFEFTKL